MTSPESSAGAPVARPGKVVCIGLNYAVHAAEARMDLPAEPVVFMKAPSTVVGPDDDVLIPVGGTKTDWEVELGVVIGSTARYLDSTDDARGVSPATASHTTCPSGTSSSSAGASG